MSTLRHIRFTGLASQVGEHAYQRRFLAPLEHVEVPGDHRVWYPERYVGYDPKLVSSDGSIFYRFHPGNFDMDLTVPADALRRVLDLISLYHSGMNASSACAQNELDVPFRELLSFEDGVGVVAPHAVANLHADFSNVADADEEYDFQEYLRIYADRNQGMTFHQPADEMMELYLNIRDGVRLVSGCGGCMIVA